MRRFTLILATVGLLAATAIAGPPSLEGERGERDRPDIAERVERMAEHLDLDPGQQKAVGAILEGSQSEVRAAHEAIRGTLEDLRAARDAGDEKAMRQGLKELDAAKADLQALKADTQAAVRGELDLGQQVSLEEMEMRRHHRQRQVSERIRERHEGERER